MVRHRWPLASIPGPGKAVFKWAVRTLTDSVLGFGRNAVFKNLDRYGNTSGGSIPIALDEVFRQDGLRRGDLILTAGFGAGLTWGTALWQW